MAGPANTEPRPLDLKVVGGTVVTDKTTFAADLGIRDGRISTLAEPGDLGNHAARQTIDASGCLVMPGAIDPHCHYNLCRPDSVDVCGEDQRYSPAAAIGGTTTIIDFAVQTSGLSVPDAVRAKRAEADGSIAVDYGLHLLLPGPISFETIDQLQDAISGGVPTVKTLTTYSWQSTDGERFGVMKAVADAGGMSLVHAEDDSIARWLTAAYLRQGKSAGYYVSETRGPLVEEAAIRRSILLAERTGSPLYILHMAARDGVDAVADARSRGLPVFGETLAAYLSFTKERLREGGDSGLLYNNYPTLKSAEDRAALWIALIDNRIQVVSSDHQAYTVERRLEGVGRSVDSMSGGQAAVELRVPVIYSLGVATGLMSPNRFVEVVATNAAKLMGLYPRKGAIAIGSDADLMIFDPNYEWTVNVQDLHMSSDYNTWEDWSLTGKVRHTVLRGNLLVEDGRFVGSPSGGKFIPRNIDREHLAAIGHHLPATLSDEMTSTIFSHPTG
jgi:dihydropyrimidinase